MGSMKKNFRYDKSRYENQVSKCVIPDFSRRVSNGLEMFDFPLAERYVDVNWMLLFRMSFENGEPYLDMGLVHESPSKVTANISVLIPHPTQPSKDLETEMEAVNLDPNRSNRISPRDNSWKKLRSLMSYVTKSGGLTFYVLVDVCIVRSPVKQLQYYHFDTVLINNYQMPPYHIEIPGGKELNASIHVIRWASKHLADQMDREQITGIKLMDGVFHEKLVADVLNVMYGFVYCHDERADQEKMMIRATMYAFNFRAFGALRLCEQYWCHTDATYWTEFWMFELPTLAKQFLKTSKTPAEMKKNLKKCDFHKMDTCTLKVVCQQIYELFG